jgi:hypothetical protein
MSARVNNETFSQVLLTPRPEASDSDDVLLALETARALETQGEFREAARWLRRAAEEAEQEGNDERVLTLARAAADLASAIGSSPPGGDAVTMRAPSEQVADKIEPEYPATTPPAGSFDPTIPPPGALPATAVAPPSSESATVSPVASGASRTERTMRMGAIRVAITEGAIRGAKSFSVARLDGAELPPAGASEAMLVFTSELNDAEREVDLLAASDSILPEPPLRHETDARFLRETTKP